MSPLLDLTLTPNRSFDRRHMRWMVAGVGAVFLLMGLRFLALGAWPVLPFMLADVTLLFWAFRANYAAGRGHERLVLADDLVMLSRVNPYGAVTRFGFDAYWARVKVEETPLGDAHVWLAAGGRRVRVGRFLSANERRDVGAALTEALRLYRAGSPSTSSIV
jgi:uncharacterized membrane protein